MGKRVVMMHGKPNEVFTVTMAAETIDLLPLKSWEQLDSFKWVMRGKLPSAPPGIEVTAEHVKMEGEIVLPKDPAGCVKLERLFCEWLAMEKQALEATRQKTAPKSVALSQAAAAHSEPQPRHFQVELDKEAQVHVRCLQGKEVLATIGLNPAGFQSLINQGYMRKPHTLKTGALHDWVEIDGVLYSFEKGNDDSARPAKVLNESYRPASSLGKGQEILVLANAASSTGFDMQFPARVGGVLENRRRPLNEESLELLQDPQRCGLLQPGLIIKLCRPTLIFKQKTADGSERYLQPGPHTQVLVSGDDGEQKPIDLSQPLNYLRLNAVEFTAVFNHPSINRHARAVGPEQSSLDKKTEAPGLIPPPRQEMRAVAAAVPAAAQPASVAPARVVTSLPPAQSRVAAPEKPEAESPSPIAEKAAMPVSRPKSMVNAWAKAVLEAEPMRFDWLTSLIYEKMAAWLGNSSDVKLFGEDAWVICLAEAEDLQDPGFKGVFLTSGRALGYWTHTCSVRFEDSALHIRQGQTEFTARGVRLFAAGMESSGGVVFIVEEEYASRFGVPAPVVGRVLAELKDRGVVLMSKAQMPGSKDPLQVIWTAPAALAGSEDPKAQESIPPASLTGSITAGV